MGIVDKDKDQAKAVAARILNSPNKAQCRICKDIIESKHVHDWVSCKGKHIFVDGGRAYRRAGTLAKDVVWEDIIYCEDEDFDTSK